MDLAKISNRQCPDLDQLAKLEAAATMLGRKRSEMDSQLDPGLQFVAEPRGRDWKHVVSKMRSDIEVLSWLIERAREAERLERENKILALKNEHTLANNLCSDHRDKQAGKSCLACEIETLERERDDWRGKALDVGNHPAVQALLKERDEARAENERVKAAFIAFITDVDLAGHGRLCECKQDLCDVCGLLKDYGAPGGVDGYRMSNEQRGEIARQMVELAAKESINAQNG